MGSDNDTVGLTPFLPIHDRPRDRTRAPRSRALFVKSWFASRDLSGVSRLLGELRPESSLPSGERHHYGKKTW